MWVAATLWGVSAQRGFFPATEGMTMLYASQNAKGQTEMFVRQTVTEVEGSGDNMTVVYKSEVLEKNMKPVDIKPFKIQPIATTIHVTDGVAAMDMTFFAAPNVQSFVTIEGDKLRIPSSLSPGDRLDDANYVMTVSMGIQVKTEVSVTDHACLAIEEITVPAGAFTCHKITHTGVATTMRKITTSKNLSWYAPGIGIVKSENYDEKGKLTNTMVLQELKE